MRCSGSGSWRVFEDSHPAVSHGERERVTASFPVGRDSVEPNESPYNRRGSTESRPTKALQEALVGSFSLREKATTANGTGRFI